MRWETSAVVECCIARCWVCSEGEVEGQRSLVGLGVGQFKPARSASSLSPLPSPPLPTLSLGQQPTNIHAAGTNAWRVLFVMHQLLRFCQPNVAVEPCQLPPVLPGPSSSPRRHNRGGCTDTFPLSHLRTVCAIHPVQWRRRRLMLCPH